MSKIRIELDLNQDPATLRIELPFRDNVPMRDALCLALGPIIGKQGRVLCFNVTTNTELKYNNTITLCKTFFDKYGHTLEAVITRQGKQKGERTLFPENETDSTNPDLKFSQANQRHIIEYALAQDDYISAILEGKLPYYQVDKSAQKLYDGLQKLGFDMNHLMRVLIKSPNEELRRFAVIYGNNPVAGLIDGSDKVRKTARKIREIRKEKEQSKDK